MTRQTFFLMAAVTFMVMIVSFTVQIYSSEEEFKCYPSIDYDCYDEMRMLCAEYGGENTGDWLAHSWCSGETCYGAYRVYCSIDRFPSVFCGYVVCYDRAGFGCQQW
jgi:hypothetical protein